MPLTADFEIETAIIGAGVVGLAIGAELAKNGHDVILLEKNDKVGLETSSHNSGVIHAGLYYPKDTLKAKYCVAGRERLYDYCQQKSIPHQNCGKFIIAKNVHEIDRLENIYKQGMENQAGDLRLFDKHYMNKIYPDLSIVASLFSPSTGIIDSFQFMQSLLGEIEDHGGAVAYTAPIKTIHIEKEGFLLCLNDADQTILKAHHLINASGLHAPQIAQSMIGYDAKFTPQSLYAKGHYFRYHGAHPFSHLIYPLPESKPSKPMQGNDSGLVKGGLGVHATLDLAGGLRFGPDLDWLDETNPERLSYDHQKNRHKDFVNAIQSYWPSLDAEKLSPDGAGIRPKIKGNGDEFHGFKDGDFIILNETHHHISNLIQLFAIESPGLTASLAIANDIAKILQKH